MTPDIHTLVGPYVLDAVDDIERAAFERHLRECPECRAEVDDLSQTAARLADGTWSVPPPRMRASVLAAIGQTRQLGPVTTPPRRAGGRLTRPRRWIAAAAAAVVVLGGGSAVFAVEQQRLHDERESAAAAQADAARVQAILAAPDLTIRQQPVTGGGHVRVAYSRLRAAGLIMLAADTAPAGRRVYQLWTVRSQHAVSEGALDVGQTTATRVVDGLPSAFDVGVTIEPAGGSTAPTLPMVADLKVT